MIAAILVQNRAPLEIAELRLPDRLAFGQTHVRIHFSGICGAQVNEIEGAKGPDKFLPHLLGHEGSGTVLAVGEGVRRVKPGDQVVLHWRQAGGLQCDPPKYDWNGKVVNAGWVTTFNDEAIVSENRLTVVPPDFDLRLAPLFGCAVTTAVGVVNNDAQVRIGQSVVVFGVGGVGLNIAQAAQMVSAHPIVGVDLFDLKLAKAREWGLTHGFNSRVEGDALAEKIRDVVGKGGADVVVDTTGNARVIELAYDLTHAEGRTILVGVPRKGDNASIYTLPLHFKKVLKGSHGGSVSPDVEIPRLIGLVRAGKMRLDGMVTHTFPLARVNEGIEALRSGAAARVLLDMGNS
jgi:S-(hydroxymethyl)glutathione dehydrogenase/alcohol dehydrogenase